MCQRGCERGRLLALGTGGLESFEGAGGLILEDVQPLLNLSEVCGGAGVKLVVW